jgi:hypothetical protein
MPSPSRIGCSKRSCGVPWPQLEQDLKKSIHEQPDTYQRDERRRPTDGQQRRACSEAHRGYKDYWIGEDAFGTSQCHVNTNHYSHNNSLRCANKQRRRKKECRWNTERKQPSISVCSCAAHHGRNSCCDTAPGLCRPWPGSRTRRCWSRLGAKVGSRTGRILWAGWVRRAGVRSRGF